MPECGTYTPHIATMTNSVTCNTKLMHLANLAVTLVLRIDSSHVAVRLSMVRFGLYCLSVFPSTTAIFDEDRNAVLRKHT